MAKRRRRKQQKNKKQNNTITETEHLEIVDEIEYVTENLETGDAYAELKSVFEKFNAKEAHYTGDDNNKDEEENTVTKKKDDANYSDDAEEHDSNQNEKAWVLNKKKKLQRRMKISQLKQLCARPDLVEVWDVTAADPKLLVFLKSYRNTVAVPRHWCQKRKFLHVKRGTEKQPFQLPDFIAATGIEKIRQAYIEKEDSKKMKQKQRERMQPKMGKMDIDYQVLHDAFFKYQTKPKLTGHGELYYEGKEFEVQFREMKPGMLSQNLREALGMAEGVLPPRLTNMHRYEQLNYEEEPADRSKHWGDFEDEVESDEEEEEDIPEKNLVDDTESVGGECISSTPTGLMTPDAMDLRKQQSKPQRQLFQVLEEKRETIAPGTLFGTTHTYAVGAGAQEKATASKSVDLLRGQMADKVDVRFSPGELEGLENLGGVLSAKYEEAIREEKKQRSRREDFSDMVAENEKKRKRKMNEKDGKSKKRDTKF